MSIQNGCVLTHEGIEYLCGLIRDINGLDTNLIDDLNIKSNGTFSSVRINTLLNALKTDCNDFANSLVSNISRLELKIVTNEADIIEHNKLYLIKKAGETSYSQYVIVTNDSGVDEKILLGTTDINISDYYTITQADTKFTLKADFNSLKTEVDKVKTTLGTDSLNTTSQTVTGGVNELKTDLTTHTNDTDIHITSAERTAWNKKANDNEVVKKTDITTTIDSTSTNTQVPGAKSVYNLAGNENRRGYVYNNPTYRGNKWNRVFRVNSLLSCDSGFLTVTVYSNGLCQIATFLMSKNFNRLNIKQINCGGYNGDKGQTRPIKVRIISAETSGFSFLEIYVSGTSNTNVVATYMPLSCNSVVVLNEEGSIPSGMFACEMTATHDTYENATYTSVLK